MTTCYQSGNGLATKVTVRIFLDTSTPLIYAYVRLKPGTTGSGIKVIRPSSAHIFWHDKTLSNIDRILEVSLDIHVHFGPDPKVERHSGSVEFAMHAKDMGMQGVVLKSHEYPTHPVAATTSKVVPELTILGGIALDEKVGELNPKSVEATADMGGRTV